MNSNHYDKFLAEVFYGKKEFLVTEQLIQKLRDEFGVTETNARKIIQRAVNKGIIRSSNPVTFGKNRYVYFSSQYTLDVDAVLKVAKQYRPPLYRLLEVMSTQKGIISYYEGLKVTAAPIKRDKTKVSSLKELADILMRLGIAEEYHDAKGVLYYIFKGIENKTELVTKHFANMVLDSAFIPDILYWLTKHNLIDNRNIVYRNKANPTSGALHNNLSWDAFAYTRTTGINTLSKANEELDAKKTLVILDVIISRSYTEADLFGLYERIQIIRNSTISTVRKVFPIIVLRETEANVSDKIRALGFMTLDVGTIYGEKIFEIIQKLQFIKLTELFQVLDPTEAIGEIEEILSTLKDSGQENNLQNIKGDLFESLMYPLLSRVYPNSSIQQGVLLSKKRDDGKKELYEYDFLITSSDYQEVAIVELKGYRASDTIKLGDKETKNTVKWFFRRTFPFAQMELRENPMNSNYRITGCYITTAQFAQDAITILEQINKGNIKPRKLDVYYDGDKLKGLLDEYGLQRIITILARYYNV